MMKQLKSLLIAAILFIGTQAVTAQAKVAHINFQELMTNMPEMKAANAQLKKLQDAHKSERDKMIAEFKAKIQQYDAEAPQVSEAQNKTRAQEVQDMQNRIQDYEESATQEIMKKQEEIYKPIIEKAQAAIKKVAKDKGYQYILDSSLGNGLLVADGPDLLADVKKELGF